MPDLQSWTITQEKSEEFFSQIFFYCCSQTLLGQAYINFTTSPWKSFHQTCAPDPTFLVTLLRNIAYSYIFLVSMLLWVFWNCHFSAIPWAWLVSIQIYLTVIEISIETSWMLRLASEAMEQYIERLLNYPQSTQTDLVNCQHYFFFKEAANLRYKWTEIRSKLYFGPVAQLPMKTKCSLFNSGPHAPPPSLLYSMKHHNCMWTVHPKSLLLLFSNNQTTYYGLKRINKISSWNLDKFKVVCCWASHEVP